MIELFDKKFVRFMWDDELEGKEGFCADDICELTNCVHSGDFHLTKVRKSLSPAFPFKDTNNNDWLFFYYDPNYEAKKAFNEGKKIQVETTTGEWVDITAKEPVWTEYVKYRVKPEAVKKYRPYESSAEMVKDFVNRFKVKYPSYAKPLIWVGLKQRDCWFLITGIFSYSVKIDGTLCMLENLFNSYTYLDGSPVGVEVKE